MLLKPQGELQLYGHNYWWGATSVLPRENVIFDLHVEICEITDENKGIKATEALS